MKKPYRAREHYRDRGVADHYDQQRFTSLKGRLVDWLEKRCIRRALNTAGVNPPADLLDLPCGTGRISLYLAARQYRVTGIDVSEAMLKKAREKAGLFFPDTALKFQAGDGESLSLPEAAFDICFCLRLSGHLPSSTRLKVLKELARVSRRWIVMAYYRRKTLQELARRRPRRRAGVFWNPVTSRQIDRDLAQAGLVKIKSFYLLPLVSETVLVLAARKAEG